MSKVFLIFILLSTYLTIALAFNPTKYINKLKRPLQFKMQIYSRSDHRGELQNIRAANKASIPCWNIYSKRVGSFDVNDPLVKVTFYRASDCKGAATVVYHSQGSLTQNHVMIKAKSVSITRVKPILLKNHSNLL